MNDINPTMFEYEDMHELRLELLRYSKEKGLTCSFNKDRTIRQAETNEGGKERVVLAINRTLYANTHSKRR